MQVAIRKIDDPNRKLDDDTLLTAQKSNRFGKVLSTSASAQAVNVSDVWPISKSDGDKIPQMTASLSLEPSILFAIHITSDNVCKELVLISSTGGKTPFWSTSSHITSPLEHPFGAATDADAMETHSQPTATESIFHPDTALVPTLTIQQFSD